MTPQYDAVPASGSPAGRHESHAESDTCGGIHPVTSDPAPPLLAPRPPLAGAEDLDDDECAPMHDYGGFRLDLSAPRGWDDGPRRQAFVELCSPPAGAGRAGADRAAEMRWR